MEIDLTRAGDDTEALAKRLRSQICIVGGGIAGLTLAHSLTEEGLTVTLLEAGGRSPSAGGADPFGAELTGDPHLGTRDGRVCGLGGSSVAWGGQVLPLPDDAEWPVSCGELEQYRPDAERLLGVDESPYPAEEFFAARGEARPALLDALPGFHVRLSKFAPFRRRNLEGSLGRDLLADRNATVVMNAAVAEIQVSPWRNRVEGVAVRTRSGKMLRVEADQYVLAAGTVETCRLLLAARSGPLQANGAVGANFHDHLTLAAATFAGAARTRMLAQFRPWMTHAPGLGEVLHSAKLEPSRTLRTRLGIQPAMAHLTIEEPEASGAGVLRGLLRSQQKGEFTAALRRSAPKLPQVTAEAFRLAASAQFQHRRHVSREAKVHLQLNIAQCVPSDSRVRLSEDVDDQNVRRALVDWRITDADLAGVRGLATFLCQNLHASGLEEVHWAEAVFARVAEADARLRASLTDARHAMGGACMGTHPQHSVVDPQLRVHGVANLSVASAAVFPDGSAQLPTLTLVALCVRLADRLTRELA